MKFIYYIMAFVLFTFPSQGVEYVCGSECIVELDPKTQQPTGDLNCTLSNQNATIPIIAEDVFESDGTTLKKYFGQNQTLCDVLGWMSDGVSSLSKVDGLDGGYNMPITLKIRHVNDNRFGASYVLGELTLDSDPKEETPYRSNLMPGDEGYSDGNEFSEIMRYFVVHEFFHYVQEQTQGSHRNKYWVLEGTARVFEDIVYDSENPYLHSAFFTMYNGDKIADILRYSINRGGRYKTFAFWKLMQDKCTLDMKKMLTNPLGNLHTVANSCSGVPAPNGDKLSGLFVYYNWAMLKEHDFSKIEGDEPNIPFLFDHLKLKETNEAKFATTADMSTMIGFSLPPFSARSFLITNETLKSCRDINLTLKSNGDLNLVAIRVKKDGSSDINDNFSMTANSKPYKLQDIDKKGFLPKKGSLFVTLTNTTDTSATISELMLTKSNIDDSELKKFTRGVLTVDMLWEDSSIDMQLAVEGLPGELQIAEGCPPAQHYFVKTEDEIKPGVYPVYVRHSGIVDESDMPENIFITIDVPGNKEAMVFDLNITHSNMLNIGQVAEIEIEEDGEVIFVPKISTNTGQTTVTHYSSSGGSGSGGSGNTVEYSKFEYKVKSKLKQALLGPLSNATIHIRDINSTVTDTPLYTSATTAGDSLLTSGLLYFPKEFLDSIDDEKLYIISISGGMDIDTDDDGILDTNPTENLGTIRAVLTGKQLKSDSFKVTILTETIYQLSKSIYDKEPNSDIIIQKLNCLANRILKADVDHNDIIDYNDILNWIPEYDKNKLHKSYNTYYQPLVEKIYQDEDIYGNVRRVIDDIQRFSVYENVQGGSIVGKLDTVCQDSIVSYDFVNNDRFIVDENNTIRVAKGATIDYESRSLYTLKALGRDKYGEDVSLDLWLFVNNIIEYAPVLVKPNNISVDEDSAIGTIVTKIEARGDHHDKSIVADYTIVENNASTGFFSIDNNGTIKTLKSLDYETTSRYHLTIRGANIIGNSNDINITINVNNIAEIKPKLTNDVHRDIDQVVLLGGVVATITTNGSSADENIVDSYRIVSGNDNGYFAIDDNGRVYLHKELDYTQAHEYKLVINSTNQAGRSDDISLTISTDAMQKPPKLSVPEAISQSANTPIGTLVATIRTNGVTDDENKVDSYTIIGGNSSGDFAIDNQGHITTVHQLDYTMTPSYDLKIQANNEFGDSNIVVQTISIFYMPTQISKVTLYGKNSDSKSFGEKIDIYDDFILTNIDNSTQRGVELYKNESNTTLHRVDTILSDSSTFAKNLAIDGRWVVVSDTNDSTQASGAGAIYLYHIEDDNSLKQITKIAANDAQEYDGFGSAIAIDADLIAIANSKEVVYIYKIEDDKSVTMLERLTATNADEESGFGSSLAIANNLIAIGAPLEFIEERDNNGAVYLYQRQSNDTLTLSQKLLSNWDCCAYAFGRSIAMSDTLIAIGELDDAISLYRRDGDRIENIGTPPQMYGKSLSIDQNKLAITHPDRRDNNQVNIGTITLYIINTDDRAITLDNLTYPTSLNRYIFGNSVALFGDMIAVASQGLSRDTNQNQVGEDEALGMINLYNFSPKDQVYINENTPLKLKTQSGYAGDIHKLDIATLPNQILNYILNGDDAQYFTLEDETIKQQTQLDSNILLDSDSDNIYRFTIDVTDQNNKQTTLGVEVEVE